MSAATSIGAALIPVIAIFGTFTFGSILIAWIVERVKWYRRDGPTAEKFQRLGPAIRSLRDKLILHYEVNRERVSPARGAFESSSLVVETSQVFARMERLHIPVPDRRAFRDDNEPNQMFWIAYLTALERLAEGGNIASARASQLQQLMRETVGMEEGQGQDAEH